MLDAEKQPTGRDRSRNAEDLFIKENLPSERNSLLYEFETDDPSTRQKNLPSQDLESDHTSLLRQTTLVPFVAKQLLDTSEGASCKIEDWLGKS
jgi:hypothetical protein